MKLQDFIDKNNGKYVDWDKKYGPQCVDLMRQYCVDVLGIDAYTLPPTDYAKNIFKRFPLTGTEKFTKIKNTPNNFPMKGDIIFWDWKWPVTGIAGHVAIVTGADVNRFIAFSQNYPTKSTCRYYNYNYKGVLGWLRFRGKIS